MRSSFQSILVVLGGALFFGAGLAHTADAQVGLTAFGFQRLQPHPHVHSLGNATVAARGYPGAIGVNPATIGTAETVRAGSNVNLSEGPLYSSPWIFSPFWIAAPSGTFKMDRWAAGIQVKHFSLGTTEVRDRQGNRLRTIDAFQQSIKIAGAYDATPGLTVGGGINLIRSRRSFRSENGVKTHPTIDLGVHYQTRIDQGITVFRPALGLSLTDFGGNVSFENQRGDLATPMTIRGGGALQVASQSRQFGRPEWRIGLYGALSNLLVSGEFVEKNGRKYFEAEGPFTSLFEGWGSTKGVFTGPGEQAEVGSWERLRKHVGMEVSILDILSVRLGRFHEDEDNGGQPYTALGFGLDAYYVSLDASWTLGDDRIEQLSYGRLTVRIPLSDSPSNFWPALLGTDE